MNKIYRIKELAETLNKASEAYYVYNNPIMTDKQYDILYSELETLELETGYILSNSPTQTVGYEVVSELKKVKHTIPLLSLDKTKSVDNLVKWSKNKQVLLMLKADGLTIKLDYLDGKLIQGVTRGGGDHIGEDITHNARTFKNLPLTIPFKGKLSVCGEAVIHIDDFVKINSLLPEDKKYATPRNLSAGSVRQLNSKICNERNVHFYAFDILECSKELSDSKYKNFQWLGGQGFSTIYQMYGNVLNNLELNIDRMKELAEEKSFPIDGMVLSFDSVEYSKSLGETNHHPLHSLAYKFEDDIFETVFRSIEINTTRTGLGSLTAIFDPVEIDGTMVGRASVYNVDKFEELQLGVGDVIEVSKRNMIIPKVEDNQTRSGTYKLNLICPSCGEELFIRQPKDARVLCCENPNCPSQFINKLAYFVSRDGMNVDGLAGEKLERLVDKDFIKSFIDIYKIERFKNEIIKMDGFGKKSYDNMIKAIEKSKETEMSNFLVALGISNVGKGGAKILSKYFNNDIDALLNTNMNELLKIKDVGEITAYSIMEYIKVNKNQILELLTYVHIKQIEIKVSTESTLTGKTMVVTGTLQNFTRNSIKEKLESLGVKVTGSVSKKTDYVLVGSDPGLNKTDKAKDLGVKIITEEEFEQLRGGK